MAAEARAHAASGDPGLDRDDDRWAQARSILDGTPTEVWLGAVVTSSSWSRDVRCARRFLRRHPAPAAERL